MIDLCYKKKFALEFGFTRWAPGTAAPEFATCPATGTLRCWFSTKSQLEVVFFIMLLVTDQWSPFDGQEYCDMGLDSNGCWLGNYCMTIESGGCPSTTGAVTLTKNMKRILRMTTTMKLIQTTSLVWWLVPKKWGRGIFSLCCPTSGSDFEMTNKMNNDKLKRFLSCETLHRNFVTFRLWQWLWQRC